MIDQQIIEADKIWPCVIVSDRYNGTYSGAQWLAFYLGGVPEDIGGSNSEELWFWGEEHDYPIGKGDTPHGNRESNGRTISVWGVLMPYKQCYQLLKNELCTEVK